MGFSRDISMAKETRLWFSTPHTSKSNDGKPHVDSYRKSSDSGKTTKTGHNDHPGKQNINVRKGK
jgi:hypothetical protein